MENKEKGSFVINTQTWGIEVVEICDPKIHRLLISREDLQEKMMAWKTPAEVFGGVTLLILDLFSGLNLPKLRSEIIRDYLETQLAGLPPKEATESEPIKPTTPQIMGLRLEQLPVLLMWIEDVPNFGGKMRNRILGCFNGSPSPHRHQNHQRIEYLWQLHEYCDNHYRVLHRFRGFGKDCYHALVESLTEIFGSKHEEMFSSLHKFVEAAMKSDCREISDISQTQQYYYLRVVLTNDSFAEYSKLKNVMEGMEIGHTDMKEAFKKEEKIATARQAVKELKPIALRYFNKLAAAAVEAPVL